MRQLFILLASLPLLWSCTDQKVLQEELTASVLLIRAPHHFQDSIPEDFGEAIEEIVDFQPQIFFSETLAPDDKQGIANWYEFEPAEVAYLQQKKNLHLRRAGIEVDRLYEQVASHPDSVLLRAHLLHALMLHYDYGNSQYQRWLLERQLKGLNASHRRQVVQTIEDEVFALDSLRKFVRLRDRNEYNLVAYPTALALGLDRFIPMDNQDDNRLFGENWGKIGEAYESAEGGKFKALYDSLQTTYRDRGELLKFMNTDYYDKFDALVYEIPRRIAQDQEAARLYEYYWDLRNRKQVDNMLHSLNELAVQRAAVIVGASHGRLFKKYLLEAGVEVVDLYQGVLNDELGSLEFW